MLKFGTALVLLGIFHGALLARFGNPSLEKAFKEEDTVNVIVTMVDSPEEALNDVEITSYKNREDRIQDVYNKMQTLCTKSQESPRNLLDKQCRGNGKKCRFQTLCISNQIIVIDADAQTIEKLAAHPGVKEMHEEEIIEIEPPRDFEFFDGSDATIFGSQQWGVAKISAEEAWSNCLKTGEGVVVANIDTGVRGTHEALRNNMRVDYNWYDPANTTTSVPYDTNGHGTHTMGTIAGQTNGIGVAPGTQWIACRGCATSSCSESDLKKCGEWCLCPTLHDGKNKNCSKAPHIVSNSWGGGRGSTTYETMIQTWRTAGIIPLFSIGNSGPNCDTANSPGDSPKVIGVGSTTSNDALSSFSSRGRTSDLRQKPDVSAPGSSIISASYSSDTGYASLSGTSMACPHAAGAVALLIACVGETYDYDSIKKALQDGSAQTNVTMATCGGTTTNQWPNNCYGWGRINVANAIKVHGQ